MTPITCLADWRRVFQDPEVFEPLIRSIWAQEGWTFPGLTPCPPGTNAVFSAGDKVIKLFAPEEAGLDSRAEYQCEVLGLAGAHQLGVCAPRLLAAGEIANVNRFPYLIMERVDGVPLSACRDSLSPAQARAVGQALRVLTKELHRPWPDFPRRLDGSRHPERWAPFGSTLRAEREQLFRNQHPEDWVYLHNDLNPDNLLLDQGGRLWVLDFADGLLAPSEVEYALLLCDTFRFRSDFIEGFFGPADREALVHRCARGLLLHDFGGDLIRGCLTGGRPLESGEELCSALRRALEQGGKQT